MTTSQQFFNNIVYLNSVSYETIYKIVGDLNKNIGLSAHFFENASQIIGSTATENYDLTYPWASYANQINSNNTDPLQQSLQNVISGIGTTSSTPTFNVCTHISTSMLNYNPGISSTFLSGQIFSVTGVGTSSVISVPVSSLKLTGNQFNSHLYDVPIDFAVYGIDNFTGVSYSGSNLINFDFAWQNNSNLLIHLNYKISQPTQYLTFYWGNTDSNFICTNYSISTSVYVGTNNFISNIGIYTTSLLSKTLTDFSGRNNFWSNVIPNSLIFNYQAYTENIPILWAYNRTNLSLSDGINIYAPSPPFYKIINTPSFNGIYTSPSNYSYIYLNFNVSGVQGELNNSAQVILNPLFSSNNEQEYDFVALQDQYVDYVPLGMIEFAYNPKIDNLGTNGFSVVNYKQDIPSAFIKVLNDSNIWQYFAQNIVSAKSYYTMLNEIIATNLYPLDNFVADFLFGATVNNVLDYFTDGALSVSKSALKEFTQPYGSSTTDPLNFNEYEEKAIFDSTNIVSSKEFATFEQGVLTLTDDYSLPNENTFEIYKPISYVCNGIDPYSQGAGLNFDYSLNLTFKYQDQSTLRKTLYVMASKYLITPNQYQDRLNNNKTVIGYYDLADPNSTDTNSYSVSSIPEFNLYGYAGLIPDLKDGIVRPILTRGFSTAGGNNLTTSYTQSNTFVSLIGIAVCMTEYALEETPYWNPKMPKKPNNPISNLNNNSGYYLTGFTNLGAQIVNGVAISAISGAGTFTLTNIPVGNSCSVNGYSINSLGSGLNSGAFAAWLYPPALTTTFPCPSPAQISYQIINGQLSANSVNISSPGGNNYYYDFDFTLTGNGFSTSLGTSYPSVHIQVSNLAKFTATVNNYVLTSFTQTVAPSQGHMQGFTLNDGCFYGLGCTASANIYITVGDTPTVDSFFIAGNNLNAGDLEFYGNFTNPQASLSELNTLSGTQYFTLYDDEIFNSFISPNYYGGKSIDYITLNCKLIEYDNVEPSGYITVNLYSSSANGKTLLASSNPISYSNFSSNSYTNVTIPMHYILTQSQDGSVYWSQYYLSVKNNLVNSSLSLQGSYSGVTTSNFYINNTSVFNDPNSVMIPGGFSTNGYDLDLGILNLPISISGILGTNISSISTSLINVYLRKDTTYQSSTNQISLSVSTTFNNVTSYIISNPVSIASIATGYTGIAFTFSSSIQTGTIVNDSYLIFSENLSANQLYISRSMDTYNVQVGLGTTNQLSLNGVAANYDFIFNKMFGQTSNNIFGSFNFDANFLPYQDATANQLQFPGPNNLREQYPTNVVDGFWSFSAQKINSPVSIYPRAWFNYNNFLGIGTTAYVYLGYTHDIYVNVGYNSNGSYNQELITLNALPKWNATWMSRNSYNYKNFSLTNIIQQTYLDNIYYHIGLGSTNIGVTTGPKSAVFIGTFNPSFGNLNQSVPITINIGTSSGVQMFINNSSQPIIDTFSVISAGSTSVTGLLTTTIRNSPVNFQINYFTLSTANIEVYWSQQGVSSLISSNSSGQVINQPQLINNGLPIDELKFLNISKTYNDAISVNSGFPPGDSFVIRSS